MVHFFAFFLLQTEGSIHVTRRRDGNKQQQLPCGHWKLNGLQEASRRVRILLLKAFCCFYAMHFFVFSPVFMRQPGKGATRTLQRPLAWWVRKTEGRERTGCEEEEEEMGKGRLPLLWHMNGSHVMMANVEQIGFEGEQAGKWGIQLALCQQSAPAQSALTLVAVLDEETPRPYKSNRKLYDMPSKGSQGACL